MSVVYFLFLQPCVALCYYSQKLCYFCKDFNLCNHFFLSYCKINKIINLVEVFIFVEKMVTKKHIILVEDLKVARFHYDFFSK